MTTAASIILEFGTSQDGGLLAIAEIDTAHHDSTAFAVDDPPDSVYFLVHLASGLEIAWAAATDGDVHIGGQVIRQRVEEMSLGVEDQYRVKTLKYNPHRTVEVELYGNTPDLQQDGRSISVDGDPVPVRGRLTYEVEFISCRLVLPSALAIPDGRDDYPIDIRIGIQET